MSTLRTLAARSLLRHKRRSLLTSASIALGLAVAIWLEGLLGARTDDMIERVTSTHTGHLQIAMSDFADNRTTSATLEGPPEAWIEGLPEGTVWAPRHYVPALLRAGDRSGFMELCGVDLARERALTRTFQTVVEGNLDALEGGQGIALGLALAKKYDLRLGDELELVTGSLADLRRRAFEIVALFDSGSPAFEANIAFTSLDGARELSGVEGIHQVAAGLEHPSSLNDVLESLAASVPDGQSMTSWREALPMLATLVTFNEATGSFFTRLVLILVLIAAANTIWMSVQERTFEFGVMTSLGTDARQVVTVILWEACFLGLFAGLVGTLLGLAAIAWHGVVGFDLKPFLGGQSSAGQFTLDLVVYPRFDAVGALESLLAVWGVAILAAALPALKAARLRPLDALRSRR